MIPASNMKTEQKFWYTWMLNYSFGELLGIGAAAIIGRFLFLNFSTTSSSSQSAITMIILVIAGTTEGLIIGFIQWRSLSKLIQDFKPIPWVATTTLPTIAGWLLILPPAVVFLSFLTKIAFINNSYSILYSVFVGMAFGGLIGIPQFFIIKKYYKKAMVWIIANAISWAISFLIIYLALSMFSGPSFVYNLFLIVVACMFSGLVQGIVTGTSLHFLMSIRQEYERKHEGL